MSGVEFQLLYWLQELHGPWPDGVMAAVSALGNKGAVWILLGAALFCFRKTRREGAVVLFSLLACLLVTNLLLKNVVCRPRPCWIDPTVPLLVPVPADFSFPSGHSCAAFAAATGLFLHRRLWGGAALLLAAVMAFSRLYLFVHFPTDVAGGAVVGILLAVLVNRAVMWYAERNSRFGRRRR